MTPQSSPRYTFPKSARLLRKRDFSFSRYLCAQTTDFKLVYSQHGMGRLGISISKKTLKKATARNRVRRLVREAFRHLRHHFRELDLNVVGRTALTEHWSSLKLSDIEDQLLLIRRTKC